MNRPVVADGYEPHAALAFAVSELDEFQEFCKLPEVEDENEPGAEIGDALTTWLAEAKPGLYRMNVCAPDHPDGYGWMLAKRSRRGPGVFEGVLFS